MTKMEFCNQKLQMFLKYLKIITPTFLEQVKLIKKMQNEILSKTKIKVNQEQKEFCERNLELSELEQGIDHLPLGKSLV